MLSTKELKQYAKACRDMGISYLKIDGLELTMTDEAPEKRSLEAPKEPTSVSLSPSLPEPTPEEILFWSSGVISE